MKNIELNDKPIFIARKTFETICYSYDLKKGNIDWHKINFQKVDIADSCEVRSQIIENLNSADNPKKYLAFLFQEFGFFEKTTILIELKRKRQVHLYFLQRVLPKNNQFTEWIIETTALALPHLEDYVGNENDLFGLRSYKYNKEHNYIIFIEEIKSSIKNLITINKLLILATTIQETIEEAKKSLTQQPPTVEAVEETQKNTLERTKLQWNASNSALYHLFAQLSEISTPKGKTPLNYTPELLAQFISESFEGLPKIDTILREIQKYRTTGGSSEKTPPKDSISLQQIDFDIEN